MKNKSQDTGNQAPERKKKVLRILANKYFIVSLAFVILVGFVDRNNIVRWCRDVLTVVRQERLIRQYRKDIDALDGKLRELSSDRDSLEKFAREQYYFQKEDEEVFIVD